MKELEDYLLDLHIVYYDIIISCIYDCVYRHVLLAQIEGLRVMHGRGPSILWAGPYHFMAVVSCLSAIRRQFCIEKSRWEFEFCPLSGIKKRPLLGGCFSITTMLISIRNTELVRCREVVRFSEGPLSEARLYIRLK